MLAVDDGLAEGGFALLEELGVLAGADGGGFEREHGAEGKLTGAELAHGHGHEPVGGEELVAATDDWRQAGDVELRAGGGRGAGWVPSGVLLGVGEEGGAVEHEHPACVVGHDHGRRCGCGFDAGAGVGVVELRLDEGGGRFHYVHVHAHRSRGGVLRRGHLHGLHLHTRHVGHGGLFGLRMDGKRC